MANPRFQATEDQRRLVMVLASCGHTQKAIATRLRVNVKTIQRHLRAEFDEGRDFANSSLGEVLYREAMRGDVKAIAEWFDRRGGPEWRKKTAAEVTGPGGRPIQLLIGPRPDFSHLSEEELEHFERLTAKLEQKSDGTAIE